MAWLGKDYNKRRLVAGCDSGSVIIWSLGSNAHDAHTVIHNYQNAITMLDYDLASERLLIVLDTSCSLLGLKKMAGRPSEADAGAVYDCNGLLGGAGFLAFGIRCVISVPSLRRL